MTNATRDANGVPVMLGTLNTDGRTTIPIQVSSSHRLSVSDGTSGVDLGPTNTSRDENSHPALMGVSSSDGTTLVPVYVDLTGHLLTKST